MPRSVLLIDDSPAVARFVESRLEGTIQFHYAADGPSGIAMARSLHPDIILVDVEMPITDGFEVCRRLKLEPQLLNVPVLLLTGSRATNERIAGLELGVVDYISKPIDPAELRARMRTAFRLKHLSDLLNQKARLDSVTGLWNQTYFDARLSAEVALSLRSGRPVAVILANLDDFRHISSTCGPWLADEILRAVADSLSAACREEDVLCRGQGSGFAFICPASTAEGAAILAQRICDKVEHLNPTALAGTPLLARCGIATNAVHPHANAAALQKAAANALDEARSPIGHRITIAQPSHWPVILPAPASQPERRAAVIPPPTQAA